jgi:hypothetical protein
MGFDAQTFMDQFIPARAVARTKPGSLGMSSQDRRSWWEFCLWMHEFLGGVIRGLTRNQVVDHDQVHQLCRLQWIVLRGTYVFSVPDPSLIAEQERYVQLCQCVEPAFALIVDDLEGFRDACKRAFGPNRFWENGDPKERAEGEALMENWLSWWKCWETAISPIAWVRAVSRIIHQEHSPLPMDGEEGMRSLDAPTPTGDSYAAVLPDLSGDRLGPEIHAKVDLLNACEREGLAPNTRLFALGCYNGVPRSVATGLLGLSKQDIVAASREMQHARPALQTRLGPYRRSHAKTQMKQI